LGRFFRLSRRLAIGNILHIDSGATSANRYPGRRPHLA
jgi:hypothetical protein